VQANLQRAAAGEKQTLMEQVREIEAEIRQKQTELVKRRCQGVIMTWNVAGFKREALVFPPISDSPAKHPLIFAWHGHGGRINNVADSMHFQNLWSEAIVVYAQGLKTETDNDPDGGLGWQKQKGDDGDRDLKLFDAMLATLRQKYSIDDKRIYTTGFSNGTGFSYLLWVERGQTLAAIGAVAGVIADSEQNKPTKPRALIAIFGTGEGTAPKDVKEKTIDRARRINATGPGQQCSIPNGADDCTLFPSATQTPVKRIRHSGGHEYPSWAPYEIMEFLKSHQRP
jgi:polyhydroxybutyrate depolymerase